MNENLLTLISDGLAEVRSNAVYHQELERAVARIDDIWHPKPKAEESRRAEIGLRSIHDEEDRGLDSRTGRARAEAAAPPKRPPPWYIGMSSNFSKAISKIDRKLQGRILEALAHITESPTTIRGDTVKPLTGELKGCWRYRLGDYRLIYSPDQSSGDITLLAFASRGSIFDD
jgi:mRNA-degrading endonuclease RelE of RelBE toxin-antitoxin system